MIGWQFPGNMESPKLPFGVVALACFSCRVTSLDATLQAQTSRTIQTPHSLHQNYPDLRLRLRPRHAYQQGAVVSRSRALTIFGTRLGFWNRYCKCTWGNVRHQILQLCRVHTHSYWTTTANEREPGRVQSGIDSTRGIGEGGADHGALSGIHRAQTRFHIHPYSQYWINIQLTLWTYMRRISDLSLNAPACLCTCLDCVLHADARHDAGIT